MIAAIARILKKLAVFIVSFLLLCFYCGPLLMFWVPKPIPHNIFIPFPVLFFIFFYALRLAGGRPGKIAALLRKTNPLAYVLILLSWSYIFYSALIVSPAAMTAASAAALVLFVYLRAGGAPPQNRAFIASSWLLCFLSLVSIVINLSRPHNCQLMRKQKNVRAVVNFCDPRWEKKLERQFAPFVGNDFKIRSTMYSQTRIIVPSPDGKSLYMAATGGRADHPTRTFRADAGTHNVTGVSNSPGGTNDISISEKRGLVAELKPYDHAVDFLDVKTMRLKRRVAFPGERKPLWSVLDDDRGELYVFFSNSNYQIAVISLDTLKTTGTYKLAEGSSNDVAYDRERGIIHLVVGFSIDGNVITAFHPETRARGRKRSIKALGFSIAADPGRRAIFLTYMFKTPFREVVEILDNCTLKTKGFVRAGFGARELDYDPATRRLFVGNYITGYLDVFDPFTGERLSRHFVGRKIRRVIYSPATEKVYVPTVNGFIEVDVGRKTASKPTFP